MISSLFPPRTCGRGLLFSSPDSSDGQEFPPPFPPTKDGEGIDFFLPCRAARDIPRPLSPSRYLRRKSDRISFSPPSSTRSVNNSTPSLVAAGRRTVFFLERPGPSLPLYFLNSKTSFSRPTIRGKSDIFSPLILSQRISLPLFSLP